MKYLCPHCYAELPKGSTTVLANGDPLLTCHCGWAGIREASKIVTEDTIAEDPANTSILHISFPETHDDFSTFMSALNSLSDWTALERRQIIIALQAEIAMLEYAESQS
jgi:hypothetical protein